MGELGYTFRNPRAEDEEILNLKHISMHAYQNSYKDKINFHLRLSKKKHIEIGTSRALTGFKVKSPAAYQSSKLLFHVSYSIIYFCHPLASMFALATPLKYIYN